MSQINAVFSMLHGLVMDTAGVLPVSLPPADATGWGDATSAVLSDSIVLVWALPLILTFGCIAGLLIAVFRQDRSERTRPAQAPSAPDPRARDRSSARRLEARRIRSAASPRPAAG